jgi:hypothetical protein
MVIVFKHYLSKDLLLNISIVDIVLKYRLELVYYLAYKSRYGVSSLGLLIREPGIIMFYI